MARSSDRRGGDPLDRTDDRDDPDRRGVDGLVPQLDFPALGYQTVIVRLAVADDAVGAVAEELRGPPTTDVYEVTGTHNVIAIVRVADREALDAFVGTLATDARVRGVTADVALRTACEYDTDGLLED